MRRNNLLPVLVAAVALAIVVSACAGRAQQTGSGGERPVGHAIVTITAKGFEPATSTVKPGYIVIWMNRDKAPHSIVLDDGSVKSPAIGPGKNASHVFSSAGTFRYHDGLRPASKGVVTVR